jgi:hypothetical protein
MPKFATLGGMGRGRSTASSKQPESSRAEVVPRAAPESGGKLLTRAEAARVLGVSETTLRRREADGLTPIVRGGVHFFEETLVRQAVTTQTHRRRWSAEPPSDGGIAADVFALFAEGVAPRDIVIRLRVPPEVVSRLCEQWTALGDGFFVNAHEAKALNVDGVADIRSLVMAAAAASEICQKCGARPSSVCSSCVEEEAGRLRRSLHNIPARAGAIRVERRRTEDGTEQARLVLVDCEVQNLQKLSHEPGRRTKRDPTLRTEWETAADSEWLGLFEPSAGMGERNSVPLRQQGDGAAGGQ